MFDSSVEDPFAETRINVYFTPSLHSVAHMSSVWIFLDLKHVVGHVLKKNVVFTLRMIVKAGLRSTHPYAAGTCLIAPARLPALQPIRTDLSLVLHKWAERVCAFCYGALGVCRLRNPSTGMVHADSALANVELKGRDAIIGPWQVGVMQLMKIFSSFPPSFSSYCPCGP